MRFNEAARVGLTVLIGGAILVAAMLWLRGNAGRAGTYTRTVAFPNAQGIQEGAYVRVRGVNIGRVDAITLGPPPTRQAVLTLRVDNAYAIQADDSIRIVGGLLGFNSPFVEITPGGRGERVAVGPQEPLPGESGPNADRLLSNLTELTERMSRLTDNLSQVAGDPRLRGSLIRTAQNFEKVSVGGVAIAGNMERATRRVDRLIASFQTTAAGLNRTLRRADTLVTSLGGTATESRAVMRDARMMIRDTRGVVRGMDEVVRSTNTVITDAGGLVGDTRTALRENEGRLRGVLDNLSGSLKQLDATLMETRNFIADPELRGDLRATAANVRDATGNLKKITEDVRGLTGDPKVQEDLRASIAGLRQATEQASRVFERVQGVFGGGTKTAKSIGQRVTEADLNVTAVRGIRSNRTRLDFDATIPWSDRTFYRLGMFDLGEGNKVNAQVGQLLRPNLWARYGVHASTLGLGLDIGRPARPSVGLDLFGVDDPRLDVRGNFPIGSNLDVTLGLDNVFRRADPVLGIRYRR